jgi:hypothetical protein
VKGPVARIVGSLSSYESALDAIENRPTYRFVHRTGSHEKRRLYTGDEFKFKVWWEGKNLYELRHEFPRTVWWTTDAVTGRTCQYFEVLKDGKWEICEDPR